MAGFAGKIAVISGAGSGLGKEIARLGCRYGMRLVLVDNNAKALDEVQQEFTSLGNNKNLVSVVADVSKYKDIQNLGEKTTKAFGVPNYVFNNAGIARAGFAWEYEPEEWEWFLGINLMGVVHGIKVFTPMMLKEARTNADYRGRIINTASMAGLVSMPVMAMYNVSKHAVVTLSETLYHDLKIVTDRVSASVLCPFFVPTNIANCPTPPGMKPIQRPSHDIGHGFTSKATKAGKVSAEEVAKIVFDSIQQDKFYIYSHPGALDTFKTRTEDMLGATNPRDPFGVKAEVAKSFRDALRHAYKL
jgi:NAD(P)-dependent dehydrogenase (short-subunit alcohol dehydrogenase family)